MRKHVLLRMTATVALGTIPATAFAQAAAESALVHAFSSTMTVGASTALQRSTNQAVGNIQGRMTNSVRSGVQPTTPKLRTRTQASAAAFRAAAPLSITVRGSDSVCAPATGAATPQGTSVTQPSHTNCSGKDSSLKAGGVDKDKYKSVITVTFPK